MANGLVGHAACEWISGYAGKRVRPAALQRYPQLGQWFVRAPERRRYRKPLAYDPRTVGQPRSEALIKTEKVVRHVGQRIMIIPHEIAEPRVRDWFDAVVHREHRRDVRMHHEPSQRAQNFLRVIRLFEPTAFRVRNGHDSVQRRVDASERLQPRGELADEAGSARCRAENHDHISGADAPTSRPSIT